MGRGIGIAAAAATTLACAYGTAAAASEPKVTYDDTFTTPTPGASAGRIFNDSFADAGDPHAKPPPVSHFHLQLPPGAHFDTFAVAQCTASDAQLLAQGASACPAASRVGGEVFVGDTGFPEPNRYITADVDFLNEKDGLIVVSRDRATGGRLVTHGVVGPNSEDLDVPMLPGTPPDGATDVREEARFTPASGPTGRAYLTTPPTCPAVGYWVLRATYTFRDGTVRAKESRSSCDHRAGAPHVTFFHRQHAHAGEPGSMRVRASSPSTVALTVARGDRRIVRTRVELRAGRQSVRLPALARGRYDLRLGARNAVLIVR
jgi:hypothetical protein